MIDFSIPKATGTALALRRCALAAAVAGGCVGTASAGAWEDFQARCLVPFENFELPDVTGLETVALPDDMRAALEAGDSATAYALEDGALLVVDPETDWDAVRACSVQSKDAAAADLNSFGVWKDAQLEQDRYVLLERTSDSHETYTTTDWIEPVLYFIVSMAPDGGSVTYSIAETALES